MRSDVPLATDYSSGALSKDNPEEFERLRLLEAWGDPDTHAVMRTVGLRSSWRCLEIGAGAGSVARWLAGQCADGSVVAIDTDTRFCGEQVRSNLQWRTEDVRSVNFPAGRTWTRSSPWVAQRRVYTSSLELRAADGRTVPYLFVLGMFLYGDQASGLLVRAAAHSPVVNVSQGGGAAWAFVE